MARHARRAGSAPSATADSRSWRSTAWSVVRGVLGLLLVSLTPALIHAAPAGAQAAPDVVPIVECSYLDPGTGTYNTVWGYQNVTPGQKSDLEIPVGPTNELDNPSANAGQPTVFKPGRAQNVFIVTHQGPSTWTLTGQSATAPGPACKSNPVPIAAGGLPGLVTLAVVTLLLSVLLWWRNRQARRA